MSSREGTEKPPWFDYYVFRSLRREPTDQERVGGVYLVGEAEAHHLQQFFEPLYQTVGIGLHPTDDEIVSGERQLNALREAIELAIRDAEHRPAEWPVEIGVSMDSPSWEFREPILEKASRSRLLEFLRDVAKRVDEAIIRSGHIHFAGGR